MVVSLYNISLGSSMLLWGRIADVYGFRRIFLLGATLFTVSNLCLPFSTIEIPFYILRWALWIPAMLSAITLIAAFLITPKSVLHGESGSGSWSRKAPAVDWLGAALVSSSLILLLISLTEGNVAGWRTAWIPPLIVVAVVLLLTFVYHQHLMEKRSNRQPLIRVSMFKDVHFSLLFVLVACFYGSFNGYTVFATYLYVSVPCQPSTQITRT